jgi:hypothetical protein
VSFKTILEDTEREVGRISTFLQCGDYDPRDIAQELRNVRECQRDLNGDRDEVEEALERAGEESARGQRYAEELGEMDDAIERLGLAEEALVELTRDITRQSHAVEAISQLDAACEALCRAMKVT